MFVLISDNDEYLEHSSISRFSFIYKINSLQKSIIVSFIILVVLPVCINSKICFILSNVILISPRVILIYQLFNNHLIDSTNLKLVYHQP